MGNMATVAGDQGENVLGTIVGYDEPGRTVVLVATARPLPPTPAGPRHRPTDRSQDGKAVERSLNRLSWAARRLVCFATAQSVQRGWRGSKWRPRSPPPPPPPSPNTTTPPPPRQPARNGGPLLVALLPRALPHLAGGSCLARAAGGEADAGAARGRRLLRPAPRVLLGRAAPSPAGARLGPSSTRRRPLQGASAPASSMDDDVADRQLRLHPGHRRRAPLLRAHDRRPQCQHHQAHRGEHRPLRGPRPPLRLPALPLLDPRHHPRHVRQQVLAPGVARHCEDVCERDDRRLRLDSPPCRRPLRRKTSVP